MRAVLLAAGRGERLAPSGHERPKVLLTFGGKTLLRRHVESLEQVGADELVVVVGYRREEVEDEVSVLREERRLTIRTVTNADWREGSILSVWAAAPFMTQDSAPLLLMDGDVLYEGEILRRLVESRHPSCLLIDRHCELGEVDPVLVPLREGRPFDFCKGYEGPFEAIGESVGFFKLDEADVPRWLECTQARVESGQRAATLEDIVRDLVLEGRFGCEDVTGLPWIEIDFPEDLDRAENEILPAIESR